MKQRVTDEQISAELACGLDNDCSRCPFVESHLRLDKDCNDLRCNDFDAYKDLQDARAKLVIAVKALECIRDNTLNPAHTMTKLGLEETTDANHALSIKALKEIQL